MTLKIEFGEKYFNPITDEEGRFKDRPKTTNWNGHDISIEESAANPTVKEFKALLNEDWKKGACWAWLLGFAVVSVISMHVVSSPLLLIPSFVGAFVVAHPIFKEADENEKQLLKSFDELNRKFEGSVSKIPKKIGLEVVLGIPHLKIESDYDLKTRLPFLRDLYFCDGFFKNLITVIFTVGAICGTYISGAGMPPHSWKAFFMKVGLPSTIGLFVPYLVLFILPHYWNNEKQTMNALSETEKKFFEDLTLAIENKLGKETKPLLAN